MGVAFCTGSGVIFRRSIIDEIGGWPVASLCEDVLCSFMMYGKGYKVAYVHENLQFGLVPESIAGRTYYSLMKHAKTDIDRFKTAHKMYDSKL